MTESYSDVTQKAPNLKRFGVFIYGKLLTLVSSGSHYALKPVLDDCLQFLDSVQMRGLIALFSLVVDLVAIYIDLQYTRYSGLNRDRNFITASIHKLVDHPGRNTVILSRYAVDDLNVHQTFASHSKSS